MKNKSKLLLSLMFISSVFGIGNCNTCSVSKGCNYEEGQAYHECMRMWCGGCKDTWHL